MSVVDEIEPELDRLNVTGWQRAVALKLAETVDDAGTASAAALLRSLMAEVAGEVVPTASPIDALRSALHTHRPKPHGRSRKSAESLTKSPTKSRDRTFASPTGSKSRLCRDCGAELPEQTMGRPRVRCPGGCSTPTRRGAADRAVTR